jgi:hypothetical protein
MTEYNLTHIALVAVIYISLGSFPYLIFIMSSMEGMRLEVNESKLSDTLNIIAFDTVT